MFDTDLAGLDAHQALALADDVDAAANRAEAMRLQVAQRWADLHGAAGPAAGPALPGAERLARLGGAGTPQVAEFAPAELGARWKMSHAAAAALIGDALDLRHRLPRLWALVLAGRLRPWVARRLAQATRDATAAAAAHADRRLARWAPSLGCGRLEAIAHAALIEADPAAADHAARAAELRQGVWVGPSTDHGIKDIHIRTDAASAIWFDATVDRVADGLGLLGDTDPKDVRRAKAVGVLAHPQHALDLYHHVAAHHADRAADHHHADHSDHSDQADQAAGQAAEQAAEQASGHAADRPAGRAARRGGSRPDAVLYVHLSHDAVAGAAPAAARVEGAGPVTIGQAQAWLGHCHVTVTPVLDLAGQTPADAYEAPDRMREAVLLRSPVDVFPYAAGASRHRDLDHTVAYTPLDQGGPPGQTRPDNLGPMTRRSHRIKTHGNWKAWQVDNGVFVWKAPHGHCYLVDHTGTHQIHNAQAPEHSPSPS
jgi:hypothetical protein